MGLGGFLSGELLTTTLARVVAGTALLGGGGFGFCLDRFHFRGTAGQLIAGRGRFGRFFRLGAGAAGVGL